MQPVVRKTAELFRFDPFCAISEGTLIAIVDGRQAGPLGDALGAHGIVSAVCGEIVPKEEGLLVSHGGRERPLEHPTTDPYWAIAAQLAR